MPPAKKAKVAPQPKPNAAPAPIADAIPDRLPDANEVFQLIVHIVLNKTSRHAWSDATPGIPGMKNRHT